MAMKSGVKEKKELIIVATFPPPIHGMSTITQAIFERLTLEGLSVVRFNTSRRETKIPQFSRLSRAATFLPAWNYILKKKSPQSPVYISLSGGWGQVYDVITALINRLRGSKCIFHHHSTAYLTSRRWLTALLFNIAGKETIHIALCETMKQQLDEKYGCQRVMVLSNLAFFAAKEPTKTRSKAQTIGFLSNITLEKGGWDVIELARRIHSSKMAVKVIVGGPCQDRELTNALLNAEQEGILQWRGAVYGTEKQRFWNDVDVFIFPTKYKNEAEPLVVWEALSAGIPVIACDRGCIRCQIGEAGKVIANNRDFVVDALDTLTAWLENPAEYQQFALATQLQYKLMHDTSEVQWQQFEDALRKELQSPTE